MKARLNCLALAAVLLFAAAAPLRARATTWFPQEFKCPVCKTRNTFMVIGSYGSYIYHWESKFQFIYWPRTDGAFVYTCKKCRLSAYMWDFMGTPKERHAEILKRLEGVRLDYARPAGEHDQGADYLRIPMTQRLLAAQKVYEVLGRDDDFWCEFYRTLGYHFEAEKKQAEADEARRKALDIAVRLLGNKTNEGRRKELLYITGAMRHLLRDDAGALRDFRKALPLGYSSGELSGEKAKGFDAYLTELIREYIRKLGGAPEEKRPAGQFLAPV